MACIYVQRDTWTWHPQWAVTWHPQWVVTWHPQWVVIWHPQWVVTWHPQWDAICMKSWWVDNIYFCTWIFMTLSYFINFKLQQWIWQLIAWFKYIFFMGISYLTFTTITKCQCYAPMNKINAKFYYLAKYQVCRSQLRLRQKCQIVWYYSALARIWCIPKKYII